MASMRVGRKWLKKTKRTRLPRLDTIPRRVDSEDAEGVGTKIVVDLNDERSRTASD
jgi:hypothetical protein